VLILLAQYPDMVLREVAARVGITERAVQRIVNDLEEEKYITRVKAGRQNTYQLNLTWPLRHPIERHRTVGDVVRVILGKA
jgi:DNA-binding Lrp family transcriptional regulator